MTEQEMLSQLRLRLPDQESAPDALLRSLLQDAAALICALTWRNAVPRSVRESGYQPKPDELLKALKADKHYLFYEDIKNIK